MKLKLRSNNLRGGNMQENIKELLELVQAHPDLPVISMVEQEAVSGIYGYTVASFGRAYLEEYALYNERYYDDRESFKEAYYDHCLSSISRLIP